MPKADFNRIGNADFNACTISHGSATDYIFETVSPEDELVIQDMNLQADFCLVRKVRKDITFYFVKNGLFFNSEKLGFQFN